jgi:sterol desaturase/sphingolipid hydroxylase (fatty acid hydroxylase superfamily)
MARRVKPLHLTPWRTVPWARATALELLALLAAEARAPLRTATGSKAVRAARNAAIAAGASLTTVALERPVVGAVARWALRRRFGLLQRVRLPRPLETALAVLVLDYALYGWHVVTHRAPFLWRFHRVHHADVDLDVTTAARFHFGEMALSVPARAAVIAAFGIPPRAFALWQHLLVLSILFHHANVRLPRPVEAALSWIVMTPRLHGLHHARDDALQRTNLSSGLVLWDVLHGTRRSDLPQRPIGVPSLAGDLPLGRILALPFRADDARGPTAQPAHRRRDVATTVVGR